MASRATLMASATARLAALIACALLVGQAPEAAAGEPRRVLLLHSFDGTFAPFDHFTTSFRADLSRFASEPIEFYEIPLQPARFTEHPPEGPAVDFILAMFAQQRPDLVVSIGGPAATFALRHRARIFPETPLLLTAADVVLLRDATLTDKDMAVGVAHDAPALIEGILKLLPGTRQIFVVLGNSPLERFWRAHVGETFKPFRDRVTFIWSDDMSLQEIVEQGAALPPDSAILYLLLSVDSRNVPLSEERALSQLHATASAPIFGMHSSQLGRGVVGGDLMSIDTMSLNAAGAALRMLRGETPRKVEVPVQLPGPPLFDARELRRWNIDEDRLPPGSIVRFREPTLWDRYQGYIVAGAVAWLLTTLLVAGLLFNLIRRRRAEQSLRESTNRLQGILDTALEGILTVNETGVIESINAATEKMFGYSASEAVGQPASLLLCAATGRRKDASTFPIEVEVSEVALPQRRITTHFVRDITERRRIEQMDREFGRRLLEAQEAERARVARELHDDVTQRLARLVMQVGRHEALPDQKPEASTLDAVRDELARVGEDVHALAYRLHPALLDRLGLAKALRIECERFARLQSLRVSVTLEDVAQEIPRAVALGLFRIAQESLSNVSRHACASAADVVLKAVNQGLELTVTDPGVGFDSVREAERPSLGLASMRERVRLLRGELAIDSEPGRGTTVRAWVPLDPDISAH